MKSQVNTLPNRPDRPIRPSKVFVWRAYNTWRQRILGILGDFIDRKLFEEVRDNPPACFASDNLSWLDDAIGRAQRIEPADISSVLVERLLLHYRFLRAFHGCRPESIEPYKLHGILPCDPNQIEELAKNILPQKDRVEHAIRELAQRHPNFAYRDDNRGKVFFCLDKDSLVDERAGHYLLYGSEYLACIANAVGQAGVLRERGRATIIECNVPLAALSLGYIKCLAGKILSEMFVKYCDRSYRAGIINFGFSISARLDPANIVAFHYPKGIPNPHNFNIQED